MGRIDVFADIACPWCFIGKRNLDAARRLLEVQPPEVRWRAFQLERDMPSDGIPAREFYAVKLGSAASMEESFRIVTAVGARVGIEFRFERLACAPNTTLAHRAIAVARLLAGEAAAEAVLDALFVAHFTAGEDICNPDVVIACLGPACDEGLDLGLARDELALGGGVTDMQADLALAAQLGVRGVPLYVAEDLSAVSGAQPPAILADFIQRASSGVPA